MKGQIEEVLLQYTYNKDKPLFSASTYAVYNAIGK